MLAHLFQTLKAYIIVLRLINSTVLNFLVFTFIFIYLMLLLELFL